MVPCGSILLHKNFRFEDGAIAEKYLVVLGGQNERLVVVKTTSKGSRYRNDFGCQAGNRFPAFYLPRGSCCLPKCTWICLGQFYELKVAEVAALIVANDIIRVGHLSAEQARDVQFCAIGSDDISQVHEAWVQESLVPVAAANSPQSSKSA